MIISFAHGFTFFHNPKAGGTSVRATLERFHDARETTWGPDPTIRNGRVDMAHVGIEEFAGLRPELWARIREHRFFCLYRDPEARFLSSVAEHAKLHGKADTRFLAPSARRDILFEMVNRLDRLKHAEAVMDQYEFTHFRPQWIYWTPPEPSQSVTAIPITRINKLFQEIAALTGEPVDAQNRNRRESLDLPRPLAGLAARRGIRSLITRLPGADWAKTALRARFARPSGGTDAFALDTGEQAEISEFVKRFYARDLELWPDTAGNRSA